MHHGGKPPKALCHSGSNAAGHSRSLECAVGCCTTTERQIVAGNLFILPNPTEVDDHLTFAYMVRRANFSGFSALLPIDPPPPRASRL